MDLIVNPLYCTPLETSESSVSCARVVLGNDSYHYEFVVDGGICYGCRTADLSWSLSPDKNPTDWIPICARHSVEFLSMVDPQWDIWHWGSKCNLHTVFWGADGCKWGTTSVYFGITCVCFIHSRLPVFAVEPQYQHQGLFIFVKNIIQRTYTKSSKNNVALKFEWGL